MKLTRKEHMARAALLGMVYDPRDGTYCFASSDGVPTSPGMLNCLTLRKGAGPGHEAAYKLQWANRETLSTRPWEREDETDT